MPHGLTEDSNGVHSLVIVCFLSKHLVSCPFQAQTSCCKIFCTGVPDDLVDCLHIVLCLVKGKGKGKGRTLVIAPLQAYQPPQRHSGTWRAQSSIAHTCLYTFPTIAGTHLPTLKGWRGRKASQKQNYIGKHLSMFVPDHYCKFIM